MRRVLRIAKGGEGFQFAIEGVGCLTLERLTG